MNTCKNVEILFMNWNFQRKNHICVEWRSRYKIFQANSDYEREREREERVSFFLFCAYAHYCTAQLKSLTPALQSNYAFIYRSLYDLTFSMIISIELHKVGKCNNAWKVKVNGCFHVQTQKGNIIIKISCIEIAVKLCMLISHILRSPPIIVCDLLMFYKKN